MNAVSAHENQAVIVLIVEDEEPIALVLSFMVEDYGYTPLVAKHGKEALAYMTDHHPSLIFTDLMMPQMNGAEFIAALDAQGWRNGGRNAIILMSAAGEANMQHIKADAFLLKPFELAQVEALLQRYLGDSQPT